MQRVSCSYTISLTQTHHPGAVWSARPSLALAGPTGTLWSSVLVFYLFRRLLNVILCECETSARIFITKVHIKDRVAPKAFRISLRNLCRTVVTTHGSRVMAWAQTPPPPPPAKQPLMWEEEKTLKMTVSVCSGGRKRWTHQASKQWEQKDAPSSKLLSDSDNDKTKSGRSFWLEPLQFHSNCQRSELHQNSQVWKLLGRIASCRHTTLLGLKQADDISRRIKRNVLQTPEQCKGGLNMKVSEVSLEIQKNTLRAQCWEAGLRHHHRSPIKTQRHLKHTRPTNQSAQ